MGLPQFAKLTLTLLDGLVTDDKWPALMHYAGWMNAYLIYETISDNLAIGLAQHENDLTAQCKRVLKVFNEAMVARLKGDRARARALMESVRTKTGTISAFKQSLTESEQRQMAKLYQALHGIDTNFIEYGTWSALVANIESCGFIADRLAARHLGGYLRQGLIWRYEAVGKLLSDQQFSLQDLIAINTHTILVIPVLTYYIAVLMEVLYPNAAIGQAYHSGVLPQALEDAALLVRLTNDLGTGLMTDQQYVTNLFNELYGSSTSQPAGQTLGGFLLAEASRTPMLTRIHKDIAYGEYNISLYRLMDAPLSMETLLVFSTSIAHLHKVYQQRKARMTANLSTLTDMLGDDRASRMIKRFVDFHEHIYRYSFDGQAGDYATKPDQKPAQAG
ncbi:MAG: hypothetical protein OHK0046_51240 [Anaerolineae bacterium]